MEAMELTVVFKGAQQQRKLLETIAENPELWESLDWWFAHEGGDPLPVAEERELMYELELARARAREGKDKAVNNK